MAGASRVRLGGGLGFGFVRLGGVWQLMALLAFASAFRLSPLPSTARGAGGHGCWLGGVASVTWWARLRAGLLFGPCAGFLRLVVMCVVVGGGVGVVLVVVLAVGARARPVVCARAIVGAGAVMGGGVCVVGVSSGGAGVGIVFASGVGATVVGVVVWGGVGAIVAADVSVGVCAVGVGGV